MSGPESSGELEGSVYGHLVEGGPWACWARRGHSRAKPSCSLLQGTCRPPEKGSRQAQSLMPRPMALPSGVVQPLPLLECTSCPLQEKLSRVKEMMDAWATVNFSSFPLERRAINLQKSLWITRRRQRHNCTLSKADRWTLREGERKEVVSAELPGHTRPLTPLRHFVTEPRSWCFWGLFRDGAQGS